ncbi:hypothetical protein CC85DRAFT_281769 [Cutaneotrichosporon oleaginosum]|uniref:Uncharacterized protein n=1 Tax=Cutaneotrichosporon oleaginosum TaxID=879819 RepID=A0A0J0XYJ1_9TREE|nr:uncharacterized protein CC85DRAFT_281769 [Cutaneotrichosporon oleaginosum]KLT46127.1 hypothetical protein CC85DRAFT_281769 [Cutaneotrichosporon oleaginosum]
MQPTQYPPQTDAPQVVVNEQPTARNTMNAMAKPSGESPQTEEEVLRLRGGCPGKFCVDALSLCDLGTADSSVNICIFPIPCC